MVMSHNDSPCKSRQSFTSFIFAVLRQVDADPETTALEMRLVYVISQMLNKKTRVTFPLQSTLAERLRVTDRTVRQCVAGLVDRGHLRVRHRGGENSALYELVLLDRNDTSGHDTGRPERSFRSRGEGDRKSDVGRPEATRRETGTVLPTVPTSVPASVPTKGRGAPKARPRKARSGYNNSVSMEGPSEALEGEIIVDSGVGFRPPPPNHLQRAIAAARRLQERGGVR